MFYLAFDFAMAVIMLLLGCCFYKSKGKAAGFLSGYNMKPEAERKKYDEDAMCRAYGKRMMGMSLPFIAGIIIDTQYQGMHPARCYHNLLLGQDDEKEGWLVSSAKIYLTKKRLSRRVSQKQAILQNRTS